MSVIDDIAEEEAERQRLLANQSARKYAKASKDRLSERARMDRISNPARHKRAVELHQMKLRYERPTELLNLPEDRLVPLDDEMEESIPDPEPVDPAALIERGELYALLHSYIARLTCREKRVLSLRCGFSRDGCRLGPMSEREIADLIGTSSQRVRCIWQSILEQIRYMGFRTGELLGDDWREER